MYPEASKVIVFTKLPTPFKYKIGKLYTYKGDIESIHCPDSTLDFKDDFYIDKNDIVIFLTKPNKYRGFKYCKILVKNGIIGYLLWDEYTHDKFSITEQ